MTNSLQQKFLAIEKRVDPHSQDVNLSSHSDVKALLETKVSLEGQIRETQLSEQALSMANQQIKILKNEIKHLEKIKSQQKPGSFLFKDSLRKRISQREELVLKKQNLEKEISQYSVEYDKTNDYKAEINKLEDEIKQLLKKRRFLSKQAEEKAALLVESQTQLSKLKNLKARLSQEVSNLTRNNDSLISNIQRNLSELNTISQKNVNKEAKSTTASSNKTKTVNLRSLYYESRFLYNFVNKAKDDFEKVINAYEFENQSNFIISYNEKKQVLTFSLDSISLEKEIAEDFFQKKLSTLRRNNINNNINYEYTPNKLVKSLQWTINVGDLINRRGLQERRSELV